MQYAEQVAHSCTSVHVPGVGWPEYVYHHPKKQWDRTSRRVDLALNKRMILAEMSDGVERTALALKSRLDISNASIYKCLTSLVFDGRLDFRVERNRHNVKTRIYRLPAKCLH